MKIELVKIGDDTWRATHYDPQDGSITDVWEGPFRSIANWIIWGEMGRAFAIRKVR